MIYHWRIWTLEGRASYTEQDCSEKPLASDAVPVGAGTECGTGGVAVVAAVVVVELWVVVAVDVYMAWVAWVEGGEDLGSGLSAVVGASFGSFDSS